MALLHICKYPGCSAAIPMADKYCEKHKNTKEPERKSRWHTGESASKRGYTYKWQKASKAFLMAHPLCAECERQGRITLAQCVDHIKPHHGDGVLFWDSKNWQPLCNSCHSKKTAREDGGFGNRRG